MSLGRVIKQLLPFSLRSRLDRLSLQWENSRSIWRATPRPVSASRYSPEELREIEERSKPIIPQETSQSSAPTEIQPDQIFPIYFVQSEVLLRMPGEQTLLEAGLDADVDMDFSCQIGGCGACMVKVLEGHVVMEEPNCMTDDEVEEGYCLACVARPVTPVVLDS